MYLVRLKYIRVERKLRTLADKSCLFSSMLIKVRKSRSTKAFLLKEQKRSEINSPK